MNRQREPEAEHLDLPARTDTAAEAQPVLATPDEVGGTLALLREAVTNKVPIDVIERLSALYDQSIRRKAESAFNRAFAEFKRTCPPIVRRTEDEYIHVTRNGIKRKRRYATLEDIAVVVDPVLSACGLTYTWGDSEVDGGGCIVERFVLRHTDGHTAPSVASQPIPIEGTDAYKTTSGGRKDTSSSPPQRCGTASTFARRYSMIKGLGLTTVDEDTDGRSPEPQETITEQQVVTLREWLRDTSSDEGKFLAWAGVEKLADFPESRYRAAMQMLKRKAAK